jgi:hypothetical protein
MTNVARPDREAFLRRIEEEAAAAAALEIPPDEEKDDNNDQRDEKNDLLINYYLKSCGLFVSSNSNILDNGNNKSKVDIEDIDESSLALLKKWSHSFSDSNKNKNDDLIPSGKEVADVTDNVVVSETRRNIPLRTENVGVKESVPSSSPTNNNSTNDINNNSRNNSNDSKQSPSMMTFKLPAEEADLTLNRSESYKEDSGKKITTANDVGSLYDQIYAKHHATPTSYDTGRPKDDNSTVSDDINQMFAHHLKENNERLKRMEDKMDALAQLVVALSEQTSKNKQITEPDSSPPAQPSTQSTAQMLEEPELRRNNNWLALWWQTICLVPKKIFHHVNNSFPIRLWKFLKHQYELHPEQIQIRMDWFLLFKFVFVLTIFSNSSQKTKGNSLESLWIHYRLYVFLFCSVMIYLFQCGIIQFLQRTLIEEGGFFQIWNNQNHDDDLHDNDNHDGNINGNENNDQPLNQPARRRARDRDIHIQQANNHNQPYNAGNNDPEENDDINQNRERNPRNNDNPNFVLRGNIHPREVGPRGFLRSLLESLQDLKYFFGSFLLSLLPMWRPEPVVVVDDDLLEDNDQLEE